VVSSYLYRLYEIGVNPTPLSNYTRQVHETVPHFFLDCLQTSILSSHHPARTIAKKSFKPSPWTSASTRLLAYDRYHIWFVITFNVPILNQPVFKHHSDKRSYRTVELVNSFDRFRQQMRPTATPNTSTGGGLHSSLLHSSLLHSSLDIFTWHLNSWHPSDYFIIL
jgi:hypothetical protein